MGEHLSALAHRAYGLRGCIYRLSKPPPRRVEWRFRIDSSRVVRDLETYFDQSWKAQTWRVARPIFRCRSRVIRALLRGYMDADGYVHASLARGVRVDSVNRRGLMDIQRLFRMLGINGRLYRMRNRKLWILQITRRQYVTRYQELVGFSIEHKAEAVRTISKQYRHH